MKLALVLLAFVLLPACAARMPEQPPGMPLDEKMMPGRSEEALTAR
jgi:hypothetical protein